MPSALQTNFIGICSYNGFTFDGYSKTKINARPVYDEANRMVKYVEYTLDVHGYVLPANAGGSIDAQMATIRQQLTHTGGRLQYQDKGFGKLAVNFPGGLQDVAYGPKPKLLSFVSLGGTGAGVIDWQVTTCVPECAQAQSTKRVLAFTYDVDYAIDRHGFLTITIAGELEIPATFNAAMKVPDVADNYRDLLKFPVPLGFVRENQKFHLSKDKRVLGFSFSDRQIPIAMPNGATEIDLRYRVADVKLNGKTSFRKWRCSLSGSVRSAANRPKSWAWDCFLLVFNHRYRISKGQINPSTGADVPPTAGTPVATTGPNLVGNTVTTILAFAGLGGVARSLGGLGGAGTTTTSVSFGNTSRVVMPVSFEVEENVFGLDTHFNMVWDINDTGILTILDASGMWQPVPSTSFAGWRDSTSTATEGLDGVLRMRYASELDTLVDLCTGTPPSPPSSGTPTVPPSGGTSSSGSFSGVPSGFTPGGSSAARPAVLASTDTTPSSSWLNYLCGVQVIEDDHVVRHKPLAGNLVIATPPVDATNLSGLQADTGTGDASITTDTPDTIQRLSSPSVTIVLHGFAERIGYRITPPELVRFRGQPVTRVNRVVDEVAIGSAGAPIYRMEWSITYILAQPVQGRDLAANPALQIGTGSGSLNLVRGIQG